MGESQLGLHTEEKCHSAGRRAALARTCRATQPTLTRGARSSCPGLRTPGARVSHGATGLLTTAYSMVKIRRLTGGKRWTPSYSRRSTSCSTGRGRAERGKNERDGWKVSVQI